MSKVVEFNKLLGVNHNSSWGILDGCREEVESLPYGEFDSYLERKIAEKVVDTSSALGILGKSEAWLRRRRDTLGHCFVDRKYFYSRYEIEELAQKSGAQRCQT